MSTKILYVTIQETIPEIMEENLAYQRYDTLEKRRNRGATNIVKLQIKDKISKKIERETIWKKE